MSDFTVLMISLHLPLYGRHWHVSKYDFLENIAEC